MTGTAIKQAPIIGLAAATTTFAVAGIAIATRGVQDHVLASLHDGFPLFSSLSLHIGNGFSPFTAGAIVMVLFLAGVVSGLSGFAFSAVAAGILWLLPPLQAVPLIMPLSTCNQLLSVGA